MVVTCWNTPLVFFHRWISCTDRTEHYFIHVKDQIWIQMIESSIVSNHINMVFNNFSWQWCQSLYLQFHEKECQGQSIYFHLSSSSWPSELNSCSQQDAQVEIFECLLTEYSFLLPNMITYWIQNMVPHGMHQHLIPTHQQKLMHVDQ